MFHHIETTIKTNQEVHIMQDITHLHTVDLENNPFHRIDTIHVLETILKIGQDNQCLIHQIATQILLLHLNLITAHRIILNLLKDHSYSPYPKNDSTVSDNHINLLADEFQPNCNLENTLTDEQFLEYVNYFDIGVIETAQSLNKSNPTTSWYLPLSIKAKPSK